MNVKRNKIFFLLIIVSIFTYVYMNGYHQYLSLGYAKSSLETFKMYDQYNPLATKTVFFIIYVLITALSIPGATILTLLAGALYGVVWGVVLVSFASSLGASLAFLGARYFFRNWVEFRFQEKIQTLNKGLKEDGIFYLLSLRLIPVIPFFLINLLMGLSQMSVFTFYWVSQVGMLAATIVYVQAGVELSQIQSLQDIADPKVLLIFTLLGVLPWFFKLIINYIKDKKIYSAFVKPKKFDYNTVVIGAGAAGLVSAYITSAVKAKVALIESNKMGGDCLNYGCVPSKALIKSAKVKHTIDHAAPYGVTAEKAKTNYSEVLQRIKKVIRQIEPHDSVERYSSLGVECILGQAKIISPYVVDVGGRQLTTKNIIIASGAEPVVPLIKGIEKIKYLTSENLWSLDEFPKDLMLVGGGAIGCELAQAFQRLGSQVTLVEKSERLLSRHDLQASVLLKQQLVSEGVIVLNETEIVEFVDGHQVTLNVKGQVQQSNFSHVMFALGRRARVENSGLETLNLEKNLDGTLKHNEYMQTRFKNVFVCGDVAGPIQLTHMAAHQAWYAAVNALFSPFKKFKKDYRVIPSVVFTDPEVAQVGKSIAELQKSKIEFKEIKYDIDDLDRAISDGETKGYIKILTAKNSDKILGATIVASRAGELIAEISLAMKWNMGLNKILATVHSYPTWSEAVKMTAGRWRQENKPELLLKWVEKFHQLRRG